MPLSQDQCFMANLNFEELIQYKYFKSSMQTPKNFITFLLAVTFLQVQKTICGPTITPTVMDNLLTIIDSYFFAPTPLYSIPIKKFLRAAFHDCMGGCDASLNLYRTENRGLQGLVAKLNQSYSSKAPNFTYVSTYLSRADFLVLLEERALAWGMKQGGQVPKYRNTTPYFVYGRAPNPYGMNNDAIEGNFPDGIANWTDSSAKHPTTVLQGLLLGLPGLTQKNIVTLLGLHGTGGLNLNNSGFQGPWLQGTNVANSVNNLFYITLFGVNRPNSTLLQFLSNESLLFTPSELNYFSPAPSPQYKMQWVGKGTTEGKIFINPDVSIYYNFTASPNGTVSGLYCPQGANKTLFNCNAVNSKYLPLSRNAQQGFLYATNNTAWLEDLVPAFLKLVNVTSQFTDPRNLQGFYPKVTCVNGLQKCSGDIFFTGCGVTLGKC